MKLIERAEMYHGKKWKVIRDRYEGRDGKIHWHDTVVHPGAVVILPFSADGNLHFVRQYRHSLGAMLLELPAGTLEADEAPDHCAKRELQEELNLISMHWSDFGTLIPAPGFCDEVQHLFIAKDCTPSPGQPDEDEDLEPVALTPVHIRDAIERGEIRDAKTLAMLFKACLSGLLDLNESRR